MEEIYPPDSFGASDKFPLNEYFESFSKTVIASSSVTSQDFEGDEPKYIDNLKSLMGRDLSPHELNQIFESCSIEKLTCDAENSKDFPIEIPNDIHSSSKLPSEYIQLKESADLDLSRYRAKMERKIGHFYNNLRNKRNFHKELDLSLEQFLPNIEPGSDFILSILVYRPFAFNYNEKNRSESLRFNHEILALGGNTLTQIRDAIICPSDDGLFKDVETTNDNIIELQNANVKYPSGFLFIDNVFYNDFRDPNSIDYSFPIVEWAKQNKITDIKCQIMENVTLNSLSPRFGYPYLYMHQGDCEHLIVFSDARVLDKEDSLNFELYPYISKLTTTNNKMCFMCSTSFAKWLCIDCDRLPQNKTFLCTDCCNAYNYKDGEKIGSFKLYPYHEKHVHVN